MQRAARAYDAGPDGTQDFEHEPALEYWRDVFLFGEEIALQMLANRRTAELGEAEAAE